MGGIPLPALGIQPSATPDPLEQYAKVVSLKALMNREKMQAAAAPGQLQLQAQAVQQGQIQTQNMQQQQKDQQTLRSVMSDPSIDWTKPDAYQQMFTKGAQAGVSPQTLAPLQQHIADMKEKLARTSKEELGSQVTQNDMYRGQLLSIRDTKDPEAKQKAWAAAVKLAEQGGKIQPGQLPAEYPGDDTATNLANHFAQGSVLAKEAIDRQKELRNPTEASLALASTGATSGTAPTAEQAKAALTAMQKAAKDSETDKAVSDHLAAVGKPDTPANRDSARKYLKTLVPSFNFNLQAQGAPVNPAAAAGKTGEEFLATLPSTRASMVKSIAEGRVPMPSSFALKTPYWQSMMNDVMTYDPQFSTQRAEIRKAFATGKTGDNIGALNTATVHLDVLGEAAKSLANGSFQPGNAFFNHFKTMFGQSAPTNFIGVRDAVAGEMANALKGNATDVEIKSIKEGIAKQESPAQLAGYVDTQLGILHQKMLTYQDRYRQQMPSDTSWSPILPHAQAVLARHGITEKDSTASSAGTSTLTDPHVNKKTGEKIGWNGKAWVPWK